MVIGLITAIAAGPAIFGTSEGIRIGQIKDKREEHRGRRCNLIASCVCQSPYSKELDGRQVVLKDGKLYIKTADGRGHPFQGYYIPYPETDHEGLVSSIDDRDPPFLNWIYVDRNTSEVKYGVRAQAQPNWTVPFDCTKHEHRLTFDGYEGFFALQEQINVWALYFDKDRDGLTAKAAGRQVLSLQLLRKEQTLEKPIATDPAMTTTPAPTTTPDFKARSNNRLQHRTGLIIVKRSEARLGKAEDEELKLDFNPPFESTPEVSVGLTGWTLSDPKSMVSPMLSGPGQKWTSSTPTEASVRYGHHADSRIIDVQASWFASIDAGVRMGFVDHRAWYTKGEPRSTYHVKLQWEDDENHELPPRVVCFVNGIDMYSSDRFTALHVFADQVTREGFDMHVSWNKRLNARPYLTWTRWIAIPASKTGIAVGMASIRLSPEETKKTMLVQFEPGNFNEKPGRLKIFLNQIDDFDRELHLSFSNVVGQVTKEGFDWVAEIVPRTERRWMPVTMGISWVALE